MHQPFFYTNKLKSTLLTPRRNHFPLFATLGCKDFFLSKTPFLQHFVLIFFFEVRFLFCQATNSDYLSLSPQPTSRGQWMSQKMKGTPYNLLEMWAIFWKRLVHFVDLISQIFVRVDRLQNFSKALGVPPSLMRETTPHSTSLKNSELRNFIWKFQCHKKLLMNEFLQPLGVDLAGIPTTLHLQQLTIFRSFTFELWWSMPNTVFQILRFDDSQHHPANV